MRFQRLASSVRRFFGSRQMMAYLVIGIALGLGLAGRAARRGWNTGTGPATHASWGGFPSALPLATAGKGISPELSRESRRLPYQSPGAGETDALRAVTATHRATEARWVESYGKLPLSFEANVGQTDGRVKFLSRGAGYTLFLLPDEAVLSLRGPGPMTQKQAAAGASLVPAATDAGSRSASAVLGMKLVGANPTVRVAGLAELPGRSNYFIGNDPGKWRTEVPNYAQVKYENVYPGVDLLYYGKQGRLEYDFVVAPGADPRKILLAVEAPSPKAENQPSSITDRKAVRTPDSPRIAANGDLAVSLGGGEVRFHKPLVYQPAATDGGHGITNDERAPNGESRIPVQGRYTLDAYRHVRFELGPYDRGRPLVIDPVLSYSTYLEGAGESKCFAAALTSSGLLTVTGPTTSTSFPTTAGAFQTTYGGGPTDTFVTQFSAAGSSLVFSTYLGGSGDDQAWGMAMDKNGNVYLGGFTSSTNFPVTATAYQTAFVGTGDDAFLTELNPTGSSLIYSTYIGSVDIGVTGSEMGPHVAAALGKAYVAATTTDPNYPVTPGAYQTALAGGTDGCLTILNTTKSGSASLMYSTFLGGSANDQIEQVAIDASNNVYVVGSTHSVNFPVTLEAFQTTCKLNSSGACSGDAFVSKIHPAGKGASDLVYSTYFGGSATDSGVAVAVDKSGNIYATGDTMSTDLPVTLGAFQTSCGGTCAENTYVAKFKPAGTGASDLVYSTYLGGSGTDLVKAIALDSANDAYVAGRTTSTDFPTASPIQAAHALDSGNYDGLVSELNPTASALIFSTYFGGNKFDSFNGLAVDQGGNIYPVGRSESTNFPTTPRAFETTFVSSLDAVAVKISPASAAGFAVGPGSLTFGNQAVGTTSPAQTLTLTAAGTETLTITSVVPSGDFGQTNTCGTSVAAGATCTISVTFTPTATGTRTGAITITDNASGSPQTVSLTGTGT